MNVSTGPIGFIGVGAIGQPIAERLAVNHDLIVCDTNESALIAFRGKAQLMRSSAEVGSAAETVFACLPSIQAYRIAIMGPGGLIEGTRVRQFVQIGTTGPQFVREMANGLLAKGIQTVDAPVTGGSTKARDGTLAVIAAGQHEVFANVEALIRSFADKIIYIGASPGMAQTLKLINNVLSAANLAVASELLVLGVKAGFSPDIILEVLNAGTGQNSATLTKIPDHVLPRTFDYGGRLEIVCKDLEMLLEESELLHFQAPLSELIVKTYRAAALSEGVQSDMTTIIRPMERAAGVLVSGNKQPDSEA
jgi:3-hydroxyisobutyrate dehydrogenase-like beta-hydroxyacid dehydrogenase